MRHRMPISPLVACLCLALAAVVAPAALAKPKPAPKKPTPQVFEFCLHDCHYRTIQRAVDAAGTYEFKNPRAKTVVLVHPGKYREGVVVDGTEPRKNFDGLTIEGTKRNPKRTILEGRNAKGELGAAQNGVEAISVDGLVLRNLWARNYQANGFFIYSANEGGQHCDGYTMDNLLASNNRSYGLVAKNCYGGKMTISAGYHQVDSAFYVGETPCDSRSWNVRGSTPCQREPAWTLLKNDAGYENTLGYSGTNSKYVKIVDSAFYNNGTGIAPDTLDSEGYEPNGWLIIERNDVFWNNYNYFLKRSTFHTVSGGLGELGGVPLNYPIGVGVLLYGSDHTLVRQNRVFGNDKWGIASFSGPGETLVVNQGDEAKNVNNEVLENMMGREGADPDGEYDLWNDDTGGGNCWGANSPDATFAPGNGKVPISAIYPTCPQAGVSYAAVRSLDIKAGLQVNLESTGDPKTILGYAGTTPPQNQQCTWVKRVAEHPKFQTYKPVEVPVLPGELTC